ncbi:hypothetical protein AVEN_231045-1 [Araneus ventricosus]|uniref:Pre-C2HC domain-containing protein n=1 Tax=Araneus ventricosus TaxID=182803 RepID=A0A4Y2A3P3_ARAVE|nr:hypothetical protein AVEN_231045-1 [Araneus ventricosus]
MECQKHLHVKCLPHIYVRKFQLEEPYSSDEEYSFICMNYSNFKNDSDRNILKQTDPALCLHLDDGDIMSDPEFSPPKQRNNLPLHVDCSDLQFKEREPKCVNSLCNLINTRLKLLENEIFAQHKVWEYIQKEVDDVKSLIEDCTSTCDSSSLSGHENESEIVDSALESHKTCNSLLWDKIKQAEENVEEKKSLMQILSSDVLKLKGSKKKCKRKLEKASSNIDLILEVTNGLHALKCDECKFCSEHLDFREELLSSVIELIHFSEKNYNHCIEENKALKSCLQKIYLKTKRCLLHSQIYVKNTHFQQLAFEPENSSFCTDSIYSSFEEFCQHFQNLQEELMQLKHILLAAEESHLDEVFQSSHSSDCRCFSHSKKRDSCLDSDFDTNEIKYTKSNEKNLCYYEKKIKRLSCCDEPENIDPDSLFESNQVFGAEPSKVCSEFSVVLTDYASNLDPIQLSSMADKSNSTYMRCGKSVNELLMRLGNLQYEEINIIISNADKTKKMPQTNPFLVQDFIKKSINSHQLIDNIRHTRQGKIQFTTKDPICAVQLLSLTKFMDTDVSTDVIWENISARFFITDIPTTAPLGELANEIQNKNDCLVVELRRFVKLNSNKVISPVLITILGTTVPETIKLWFIRQRTQPFVDRPRQCNKCFVFTHGTRTCYKNNICFCCGGDHIGPCQQPPKCVNCSGSRNAKSRSYPVCIQEQKILELKCHNHITIGEARRIFQQKNAKYAESVKTLPAIPNIEESLNAKFENLLKAVNDRFEQQMQLFADMLQKSMNCILQNFFKLLEQSVDPSLSPARKKKLLSKFNQISSTLSTWDAGGSSEAEQMSLN